MTRPIVILGAARSGTKALRDTMATADGVQAVPYDVGYLWKLGNESTPHDELDPDSISDIQAAKIRSSLLKYGRNEPYVVEKTVGNSLRVPFVARVLPDAHFVVLLRDGYDVTESSVRQWQAKPDFRYMLAKARHFPFLSARRYAARYLSSVVKGSIDSTMPSWGPRYRSIDTDLADLPLAVVCAQQWAHCVTSTLEALPTLGVPYSILNYESFATDPEGTLARLGTEIGMRDFAPKVGHVRNNDIGKGQRRLEPQDIDAVSAVIDPINALVASRLEQP